MAKAPTPIIKKPLRYILLSDGNGHVIGTDQREALLVGSATTETLGIGTVRKKQGNGIKYIRSIKPKVMK